MTDTLIDANLLIDVATADARWSDWSQAALERCADDGHLHINPIRDAGRYRSYFPKLRLITPDRSAVFRAT